MKNMIHWIGTPRGFCERKDSRIDTQRYSSFSEDKVVIFLAEASFIGNVTCKRCKQSYNKADSKRRINGLHSRIL